MLLIVALLLIVPASSTDTVFLEEPNNGEETLFVPVNSTARFTCHTTDRYSVTWKFTSPYIIAQLVIRRNVLRDSYGFPIDLDQPYCYKAVLTVTFNEVQLFYPNGQFSFNQTVFQCEASLHSNVFTRQFRVTVYGPPPSPTNLVARVKSDSPNMLDISWSTPPFIPGAPVNFRITITKLDTSEDFRIALTNQGTFENFRVTLTNFMTSETTSEVVAEEHYVFDAGSGRRAPDTYLIEVEAVNPAGSSLPAELLAILPNTRRGISPAQVPNDHVLEEE